LARIGRVGSRLRPLSSPAVGLLLLIPVALFITASVLKDAVGVAVFYEGLGFLADPRQLPWYNRLTPMLFLLGPMIAAAINLAALVKLEAHRENDRVVTTITFTPRPLNLIVAVLSLILLAVLGGYVVAEHLAPA
jgi:hypothetical protein